MPATATSATGAMIVESVEVVPVAEHMVRLCSLTAEAWTEHDLCWYVAEEIARIHGPQLPRMGEAKIIPAFYERFGADGVRVARHVFEARSGMWKGAPVTLARFSISNDDFFSHAIIRELKGA